MSIRAPISQFTAICQSNDLEWTVRRIIQDNQTPTVTHELKVKFIGDNSTVYAFKEPTLREACTTAYVYLFFNLGLRIDLERFYTTGRVKDH